jgi:hypothetical protein
MIRFVLGAQHVVILCHRLPLGRKPGSRPPRHARGGRARSPPSRRRGAAEAARAVSTTSGSHDDGRPAIA